MSLDLPSSRQESLIGLKEIQYYAHLDQDELNTMIRVLERKEEENIMLKVLPKKSILLGALKFGFMMQGSV